MLFTPLKLGPLELHNRFVHASTYEAMSSPDGAVTDRLLRRYRTLATGDIGLIIPGYMYVHALGRCAPLQVGIERDDRVPGLRRLVETIKRSGSRVAFQLVHAGRQTSPRYIGARPLGPSSTWRDPAYLVKPRAMTEQEIEQVVDAFGEAARRAVEAGVDAVQIQASHGYLVSQFLSPFHNRRRDRWGGSDEGRFRLLREIVLRIRQRAGERTPILVKLNVIDHTPRPGVTPEIAARYAGWLAQLGVDGLELSQGAPTYAFMPLLRGDVPRAELMRALPWHMRIPGWIWLGSLQGKFPLVSAYNMPLVDRIRPHAGGAKVAAMGGLRRLDQMDQIVSEGRADFIALCRPLVRQPHLIKLFRDGRTRTSDCRYCNRCFAAVASHRPVRCHYRR